MADSATDILSVEDAKMQVRADGDEPEINAIIERAIKGAVGYVERYTRIPLIDRERIFTLNTCGTDEPLVIPVRDVKEVVSARYWEAAQKIRENPSGTITVANLGRLDERLVDTHLYPPAEGLA